MRNSIVQIVAFVLGLTVAAASQDFLPSCWGVKPPLLVAVVLYAALYLSLSAILVVAVAAGFLSDALSGLAPCCATAVLPLVAIVVVFVREGFKTLPYVVVGACGLPVALCMSEIWFAFTKQSDGFLLVRLCVAIPLGILVGAVTFPILDSLRHHIGLADEEEVA